MRQNSKAAAINTNKKSSMNFSNVTQKQRGQKIEGLILQKSNVTILRS